MTAAGTRSITFRLTRMFAVASLVVFTLVGLALQQVLERAIVRQERSELSTRLELLALSVQKNATAERFTHVRSKLDAVASIDASARVYVLSDDPRFAYGDAAPALHAPLKAAGERAARGARTVEIEGRDYHATSRVIPANGERPDVVLAVAVDAQRFDDARGSFAAALLVVIALACALVAVLGHRTARIGLAPLSRLSEEAHALSPRNLSARLRIAPLPAELVELAGSFNGALERLEHAYTQLSGFNADVAHELRTPLTNLIGQTQVALQKDRTAAELVDVLQSNLEELERLRTIVNDMLFLARADRGERVAPKARASIAAEAEKTIEFMDVVFDEAGVDVEVRGDAHAPIEPSLFHRALANLLQNAVEHAAPGTAIRVLVEDVGGAVRVTVENEGPAIDGDARERLFDRFFRVDGSRARHGGDHHGLGLAIVKAVALMHGGDVFAGSDDGTTRVGFTVEA